MLGPKSLCTKVHIPVRYVLVALLFVGQMVTSFVITNLSLAIVAMVKKPEDNCTLYGGELCSNITDIEGSCPRQTFQNGTEQSSIEGIYTWSTTIQGVILGGYFYGVAGMNLVAGRASDKLNLRWFIGVALLFGATFTALIPIAAEVGYPLLIALRILTGMSQNVIYVCVSPLLVRWIPQNERNLMYSIIVCGFGCGTLTGPLFVGFLSRQNVLGGWPSVFYIVGAIGITWSLSWMLLVSDQPSTHPRITIAERNYILQGSSTADEGSKSKEQTTPWKAIFTSFTVWSFVFSFVCTSWLLYSRLTLLPNYMSQVLHFEIVENGEINSLINGVYMLCTFGSGYIADKILKNNWMSRTNLRKLMDTIGLGGSSLCLLAVIHSGCNATLVITFLTMSAGLHGFTNSGDHVMAMDLAPSLPGTLFGIANTFATCTGFISPLITGVILDSPGLNLNVKWDIVFYMSAVIGLAGTGVAIFFFSAEVQPWDPSYIQPGSKESDEKSCKMEKGGKSNEKRDFTDRLSNLDNSKTRYKTTEGSKTEIEKY